jgi:hypothetical protein
LEFVKLCKQTHSLQFSISANESNQKKNTDRLSNGLLAVINSLIAAGTTPSSSYCKFEFFPTTTKQNLHKLRMEQQFINPVE